MRKLIIAIGIIAAILAILISFRVKGHLQVMERMLNVYTGIYPRAPFRAVNVMSEPNTLFCPMDESPSRTRGTLTGAVVE